MISAAVKVAPGSGGAEVRASNVEGSLHCSEGYFYEPHFVAYSEWEQSVFFVTSVDAACVCTVTIGYQERVTCLAEGI